MRSHLLFIAILALGLTACNQQPPAQVLRAKPSIARTPPKNSGIKHKTIVKNKELPITHTRTSAVKPIKNKPAPRPVVENHNNPVKWVWPTKGSILTRFTPGQSTFKGIDISGLEGTPVVAASDGEVVYSGNSLRGYGNLIIIKHNKNFLSAYAHNKKNMVKEGDKVVIGQRIAEMGQTGTDKVKLHFEVRYQGKPIDPQGVLPKR